jgi:hypothetical protein
VCCFFVNEPLPHVRLGLGLCSSRTPCPRYLPSCKTAMSRFRQRTSDKKSRSIPPMKPLHMNGSAGTSRGDAVATSVAGALLDYSLALLLVFGGCCSYVSTSPRFSRLLASYYKNSSLATSGPMRSYSARIPAPVCSLAFCCFLVPFFWLLKSLCAPLLYY